MQTFLPYSDFQKTFSILDYRRLGKQRSEAKQIYSVLTDPSIKAWRDHPAVQMWRYDLSALVVYHNMCIEEWVRRGYKNNMPFLHEPDFLRKYILSAPPLFITDAFTASHRSNLLRKNFEYYSKYPDFVSVGPDLPYVWPDLR